MKISEHTWFRFRQVPHTPPWSPFVIHMVFKLHGATSAHDGEITRGYYEIGHFAYTRLAKRLFDSAS